MSCNAGELQDGLGLWSRSATGPEIDDNAQARLDSTPAFGRTQVYEQV
jgi:hypothetical protein